MQGTRTSDRLRVYDFGNRVLICRVILNISWIESAEELTDASKRSFFTISVDFAFVQLVYLENIVVFWGRRMYRELIV